MDRYDGHAKSFATTFNEAMADPSFADRATLIEVPPALDRLPRGPFNLADELTLFWRVLRAAFAVPALLLFSSRGHFKPEVLAVVLLSLLPARMRPQIVLYGEMFEPNPGFAGWCERLVMRLADRAISRYVVYSTAERQVFAENWGVSPEKIRFCPFFIVPRDTLTEAGHSKADLRGGHVFAGGNSFRDYDPLLDAARTMPGVEFYIGTRRLDSRQDLPGNVRAAWFDRDEWDRLVSTAAVVVVPLRPDLRRTAGLLTVLEAMWSRRPLVVSDALGVRDYVAHGVTGLVVDGTAESYARTLRWALEPEGRRALAAMGEAGHGEVLERFTLANHCSTMLRVIDEALAEAPAPEAGRMQRV
jgi:glycosyltransferase involved in cell wall biosynthesis